MFVQERYFGKFKFRAMAVDEAGKARVTAVVDMFNELFKSLDESIGLELFFEKNKNTILANRLAELFECYSKTDPKFHIKLGSMLMFARDLEAIKSYSETCFKKFRSELIKQRRDRTWEGFRFEVRMYASLLRHGCDMRNRESPDLCICHNSNQLFAEVTECKLADGRTKPFDAAKKITSTINKKNKKNYVNNNTVLYVNITNVLNSEIGEPTDLDKLAEDISNDSSIKFGAIILFTYSISEDKTRYNQVYKRITLPDASQAISSFLTAIYPLPNNRSEMISRDHISSIC